jgi:nucleotide-binding universal stress UspA family protein
MRRHRNILAVLDGSEAGFLALSESIRLARWNRGRVAAMVVVPPYEGDLSLVGVKNFEGAILGSCEEILKRAVDLAESMDVRIGVACEEGEPHEKILEYASAGSQDLIVLGAPRENSWLRLVLGSTASRLIESCPRDVLIVSEGIPVRWESALLVIDEMGGADAVIDGGIELASSYGVALTALFTGIHRSKDSAASPSLSSAEGLPYRGLLEDFRSKASKRGLQSEGLLVRDFTGRAVRKMMQQRDIGMVVVGSRGRRGLWNLLTGRSLEAIIQAAWRPVLVLTS